jgi:uncharacterized protein involved in tolerance to divalent cations
MGFLFSNAYFWNGNIPPQYKNKNIIKSNKNHEKTHIY